jgi:hypothetical protein
MMEELDKHFPLVLQFLRENKKLRETIEMLLLPNEDSLFREFFSNKEIFVDPTKVEAIIEWYTPMNAPKVRSFMGFSRYY